MIYSEEHQAAHSLNHSASVVWRHCDGEHSVQELTALLGTELGTDVSEPIVEYALEELSRAHLLEASPHEETNTVSRRDLIRRISYASAAALALPVVMSIAMPTPAMAASGDLPPDPGPD